MVVLVGLLTYFLFIYVPPEPSTVLDTEFALDKYLLNEWIRGVEGQAGNENITYWIYVEN